jgi:hypothetical protein
MTLATTNINMVFDIIIGIVTIYGLYFYIQGCQELTPEVRKSWPPQDIEQFTEEKNQQRYFGQIILCLVGIYFMFILI